MGIKTVLTQTKTTFTILALFASLLLLTLSPVQANAALQDNPIEDFPTTNGEVYAIASASDGSVYIGGTFTTVDGVSRRNVARILSDNSVDPEFNPNIYGGGDGYDTVRAFALDENSSTLFVGGGFTTVNGSITRNNLAAVSSETGLVTSFNPNVNSMNSIVNTLELNETGDTLYAGGGFTTVNGGTSRTDVAAFATDTGTVTAFDADISASSCEFGAQTVYDLLYDSSADELYIAGHFYNTGGAFSRGLSVVDAETGLVDEAFVPDIVYADIENGGDDADLGLCPEVKTVHKIGDTIYAGGVFDRVNGDVNRSNFAAFDTVSGTVTALDRTFNGTVYDMSVDPIDGDLYIGGGFSTVDNVTTRNEVAALDVESGELTSFNPNITTEPSPLSVHALAFTSRGYLYAGGTFDHVGGEPRASLAAFANPDPDNDGVTSEVEGAAPNNGDANNDSIPDSQQANVTSILNTDSNQYVTIVAPSGTTLSTTTAESAPTEDGYTHLFGLTGFTISGVTPGDTIEVSLFYPNPDNIDPTTITPKKYFPSTTSYEDLPTTAPTSATLTSTTIDSQPTLNLTYNLTDGGTYDLDQTADGSITDPVSLATTNPDTTDGTADVDAEGLAETGESRYVLLGLAILAIILGWLIRRKYARP